MKIRLKVCGVKSDLTDVIDINSLKLPAICQILDTKIEMKDLAKESNIINTKLNK